MTRQSQKHPNYPLVIIEWTDAAYIKDNWYDLEKDYVNPATCVSVGFLVGDHKKVKTLYPHISLEDERTNACGRGNIMIPTNQIISIRRYKWNVIYSNQNNVASKQQLTHKLLEK